jgi:hypothetical protein
MSDARCYLIPDVLKKLQMSRRTFARLRAAGKLPMLEELLPRLGRPRFRADLLDRYLAGDWGKPRVSFGRSRR